MSAAKNHLAEKAKAASRRDKPPERKASDNVRVKPVRLSVDLQPDDYRSFDRLCGELAEETGAARVFRQDVIKALLAELQDSTELRTQVTDRLRKAVKK